MNSATQDMYWPDRPYPKQPLARPTTPKDRYWPDRTGRNLGIGQTEQTEIWVLARPNRPKYGYWPDRTDRNMGIHQTEQTKIAIGQTEGATQFFSRPLWTVAPDPPVRDPSQSGQHLYWVADFILGGLTIATYSTIETSL